MQIKIYNGSPFAFQISLSPHLEYEATKKLPKNMTMVVHWISDQEF